MSLPWRDNLIGASPTRWRSFEQMRERNGIAMHSDREFDLLTGTWSRGPDVRVRPNLPHRRLQEHAERDPDATAVVYEGGLLTYAELDRQANRVGHRLRALGVGPDVIVGLYMARCAELVISTLGVYKAGGACLLLETNTPEERLIRVLDTVRPRLIVTVPSNRAQFSDANIPLLYVNELTALPGNEPLDPPNSGATPNNLATIFLTSGSTGTPKAVMLPFGWYPEPDTADRWDGTSSAEDGLGHHVHQNRDVETAAQRATAVYRAGRLGKGLGGAGQVHRSTQYHPHCLDTNGAAGAAGDR